MTCDCCRTFADYFSDRIWEYLKFMPNCVYCNARHIQYMQRFPSGTRQAISAACTRILERAKGYGNDESKLRALAKSKAWAVQPSEAKGAKK